jgi:hypothetical protein
MCLSHTVKTHWRGEWVKNSHIIILGAARRRRVLAAFICWEEHPLEILSITFGLHS